jgi:hypothetical protein
MNFNVESKYSKNKKERAYRAGKDRKISYHTCYQRTTTSMNEREPEKQKI